MASDMNTSEDTEWHRDMAEGNAVLQRYKQKKKEEQEGMLASIKATYMLRSGRNLTDEKPQEESHEGNDNSKKVTKKKDARNGWQSEEPEQNDDEKPNRRGQKRRKGNTEEDNNETDVQNDKGIATNPINDEDKSRGEGKKEQNQIRLKSK